MRSRKNLNILFGAALALMADSLPAVTLTPIVSPPQWTELQQMADLVTWNLKPRSVLVDGGGGGANLRLKCGNYGVFDLFVEADTTATAAVPRRVGLTATPACTGLACGSEKPALYPSITIFPPLSGVDATGLEGVTGDATVAKASSWIPCADGACFAAVGLSGYVPSRPWIAVLDWHNLHGWSVGWTILGIAGQDQHDAVLLPLDEARLIPFSRTGSTDVHVLTQLCSILEEVDIRGIAPPSVINMSFGRRFRDEDGESAATCDRATLSCQVARVLARLVDAPAGSRAQTVAVASSGNDREALFPAGLEAVLPAGSLQLGVFEVTGRPELSWETPSYAPRAEALMPGYGLCISDSMGSESTNEWAAPAGTSYAAAVFSGWLAGTLSSQMGVSDPLDPRPWFPARICNSNRTSCTHRLTHGTTTYGSNPRIDALFLQVFHPRRPCGTPALVGPNEVLKLTAQMASEGDLPDDSFLDVFADFKMPAPPSSPCVPCRGMTSIDGGSSASFSKASPRGLSIDLSGISTLSLPFPPALASQTNVEGLFLRLGDLAFLRLVPTTITHFDFSVLETGTVRRISISGVPDFAQGGAQPSLVFVLRPTQPDLTDHPFWVSIPILIGK